MKYPHNLVVILALMTGTGPVAAQQHEYKSGTRSKVYGETSILELRNENSEKVVEPSGTDKEGAGLGAFAGALGSPLVNTISTGLKNYAEQRANSFSSTHDARCAWNEQVKKAGDEVHHVIPSAKYSRTVLGADEKLTLALSFVLRPIMVEEGKRYAYRLESVQVESTSARLTKKAKHITLEVKPTIDYFVDGERKSMELGTMRLDLLKPGAASQGAVTTIDSDQFFFEPKYRFAGMSVAVTEMNPQKAKADKRKDRLADYNTDANKEAVVKVINILFPESESGSGDTAPEVEP